MAEDLPVTGAVEARTIGAADERKLEARRDVADGDLRPGEVPVAGVGEDVLERERGVFRPEPAAVQLARALGAERVSSLRMWLPMVGPGSRASARLEEIEVLSLGIEGKRLMWAALAQLSSADERLSGFGFPDLKRRARSQRDRLERFRLRLAAEAFGPPKVAPMRATA